MTRGSEREFEGHDAGRYCNAGGASINGHRYFPPEPFPEGGMALNLSAGTTFADRITIKRPIKCGRHAEIYLAQDVMCSEEVAIAILRVTCDRIHEAELLARQELQAHRKIADYRHVVRLHDIRLVPWGDEFLYIRSMEYGDGGPFRDWLVQYRDDVERRTTEGVYRFQCICRGIAALHEAGIMDCDVKPDNALFVNGVLKVSCSGSRPSPNLTGATTLQNEPRLSGGTGTPEYMAPECFSPGCIPRPDPRWDIYRLGVILYQILDANGRLPFSGSYAQLRELHREAPMPPLSKVDERLACIVRRCLDKDPDRRYPSIAALLKDLDGNSDNAEGEQRAHDEALEREAHDLWGRTQHALGDRNFNAAIHLCQELLEKNPHHIDARRLLDALQIKYEQAAQLYRDISAGIGSRCLTELVALLHEAVQLFPDHPSGTAIQANLRAKAQGYRLAMTAGVEAQRRGDWRAALSHFLTAREFNPGSLQVDKALCVSSDIQRTFEDMRGHIDKAIADGNRRRALALARDLDDYIVSTTTAIAEQALEDGE